MSQTERVQIDPTDLETLVILFRYLRSYEEKEYRVMLPFCSTNGVILLHLFRFDEHHKTYMCTCRRFGLDTDIMFHWNYKKLLQLLRNNGEKEEEDGEDDDWSTGDDEDQIVPFKQTAVIGVRNDDLLRPLSAKTFRVGDIFSVLDSLCDRRLVYVISVDEKTPTEPRVAYFGEEQIFTRNLHYKCHQPISVHLFSSSTIDQICEYWIREWFPIRLCFLETVLPLVRDLLCIVQQYWGVGGIDEYVQFVETFTPTSSTLVAYVHPLFAEYYKLKPSQKTKDKK
jgi:hypothetical protein